MDFSGAIRAIASTLAQLAQEWEVIEPPRGSRLEDIQRLSPAAFERWVGAYFQRRGYRVKRTGTHGTGGDHGIDLVIAKGGERAVVQCKNFRAWKVGEPTIRDLYGVMHAAGAGRAYLVTTGRVTAPAWEWARGKPIDIWDGEMLRELIAHEPRAQVIPAAAPPAPQYAGTTAPIPAPPATEACPRCGAALVERRNRATGDRFLGCSAFPKCRYTRVSPAAGVAAPRADRA